MCMDHDFIWGIPKVIHEMIFSVCQDRPSEQGHTLQHLSLWCIQIAVEVVRMIQSSRKQMSRYCRSWGTCRLYRLIQSTLCMSSASSSLSYCIKQQSARPLTGCCFPHIVACSRKKNEYPSYTRNGLIWVVGEKKAIAVKIENAIWLDDLTLPRRNVTTGSSFCPQFVFISSQLVEGRLRPQPQKGNAPNSLKFTVHFLIPRYHIICVLDGDGSPHSAEGTKIRKWCDRRVR